VDDLSFDALVADLESVVDAARLDRFTLLGLSRGCAVAIAYAVKHPQRASHLVLCGGYAQGWRTRGDPDEIARRDAVGTLMQQGWGTSNPAFRQLLTSLFIPDATPEQTEAIDELQRKALLPENATRLYQTFADIDISPSLHQVTVPTLVLHARGDQLVPYDCGRVISEGIPGARLVPLEGSNHILLAHQPAFARCLDEMRQFIATDDRSPGSTDASDTDGEQKHVTVLAVEIVSPLHAFASMDPGLVLRQIDPLLELAFGIIERNGGVVSAAGESNIIAVFGLSPASEHAASACRTALAVKSTIELKSEGTVRVRAGLDTGDVIVRRRRRGGSGQIEVTGGAVRTAARLAQSLRRGALALTDRTRVAVSALFEVAQLARSDLPKFDRGEPAYELKNARISE
jgi:class 3 adenylate cyclase